MKKIIPILVIVSILVSCFAFSVGAETIVETDNDFTLKITKIDEVYKYSNSVPNGQYYYNQPIPSNTYNSWNGGPYSTLEDLCECDYFYMRMYPKTEDFSINVDAGGIFETGLSFVMYAITGDPSTGNPPQYASGAMPVNIEDKWKIATPFVRVRLVNESGSLEYFVDLDLQTNPNNEYVTWSKTSWRNISGEQLYVDYFEFGCKDNGVSDPIFYFYGRCLDLVYRLYSPSQAIAGDITNALNKNAEETKQLVIETHTQTINEIKSSADKITGSIENGINKIENSIDETRKQITNGWTPKPETPSGSEDLDDLESVESTLNNFAGDNLADIGTLNDDLRFGLAEFTDTFTLFIGLFNRMHVVGWFRTIIAVALALGIISFILNIWPSAVRSITSKRDDKMRPSNDRKRWKH